MDKLTRQQEDVICELLHHSHSEEVTQYILERIGRENWTRAILSDSAEFLTEEQNKRFTVLGRGYSFEEVDEMALNDAINEEIAERLKQQGITSYLYENEDYINAIRQGEIICESVDIEDIKNTIIME